MNRFRRLALASSVYLVLAMPAAQAGSIDLSGLAMHGQTTERQAAMLAFYWLLTNRAPRPAQPDEDTRTAPKPPAVAGRHDGDEAPTEPAARAEARQLVASTAPDMTWPAL